MRTLILVIVLVLGFVSVANESFDPCEFSADDCMDLSIDHGPQE